MLESSGFTTFSERIRRTRGPVTSIALRCARNDCISLYTTRAVDVGMITEKFEAATTENPSGTFRTVPPCPLVYYKLSTFEDKTSIHTMAESQTNIRNLFATAKQLQKQLESLESSSQVYQDNLQGAISTLEECRKLADKVSLFSPNETADDISSGDLHYLSIDYVLGDLVPRTKATDRKPLLRASQEAYERYLSLLDTYDLLSKSDKKLYERYLDNRDSFSLLPSDDVSIRRETKIARFQQEKDLKQKLQVRAEPGILPSSF